MLPAQKSRTPCLACIYTTRELLISNKVRIEASAPPHAILTLLVLLAFPISHCL